MVPRPAAFTCSTYSEWLWAPQRGSHPRSRHSAPFRSARLGCKSIRGDWRNKMAWWNHLHTAAKDETAIYSRSSGSGSSGTEADETIAEFAAQTML